MWVKLWCNESIVCVGVCFGVCGWFWLSSCWEFGKIDGRLVSDLLCKNDGKMLLNDEYFDCWIES